MTSTNGEKHISDWEFYQGIGICPRCRKNKLYGSEKQCPGCSADMYVSVMRNREKEHYNQTHREWGRKAYQNRKEKGICTRCGKRKPDNGFLTCGICRKKGRDYRYTKEGKPGRMERVINGLCYFCGNPVKKGYKVCEKHYRMCVKNCTGRQDV